MHKRTKRMIGALLLLGLLTGCGAKAPQVESVEVVTEENTASAETTEETSAESASATSEEDASAESAESISASSSESTSTASSESTSVESDSSATSSENETTSSSAEGKAQSDLPEGSTLRIVCWNDDLRKLLEAREPSYKAINDNEGMLGDVHVVWDMTETDQTLYWTQLESRLQQNAEAEAATRIDLFLIDATEAARAAASGYAMPLTDLGIDEAELAEQYPYARDLMANAQGAQCGAAWEVCPGAVFYRRDFAQAVLGSAEPEDVQKALADWTAFRETAQKMKSSGHRMTATVFDTFRVSVAGDGGAWVRNGRLRIPEGAEAWANLSKDMLDAEQTTAELLWGEAWQQGVLQDGDVFCYFGPAWLFQGNIASAQENAVAAEGNWGICAGPQPFYWGGTWICAAEGTDNAQTAADLIRKLTVDPEIMKQLLIHNGACVNARSVMENATRTKAWENKAFGGQNPYAVYHPVAEACVADRVTAYDAICEENFRDAVSLYFEGMETYEESVSWFAETVREQFPDVNATALIRRETTS